MKPSRRSQPYRKGPRGPGPALDAMRKGAPASMPNPSKQRGTFARALARRRKKLRRVR